MDAKMDPKMANSCSPIKSGQQTVDGSLCLTSADNVNNAAILSAEDSLKGLVPPAPQESALSRLLYSTDEELFAFLILLILSYVVFGIFRSLQRPPGIPPGPRGVPILGYAPFLMHKPQVKFKELGKVYGNMFSVYLGKHLTIVLNDYDAVKAAFIDKSNAFASRRPGFINAVTSGQRHDGKVRGIAMTNGAQWKCLRSFNMSALRSLGAGKEQSQLQMLGEIDIFCNHLDKLEQRPVNPILHLRAAIINILFIVTLGCRPDDEDKLEVLNNFLDDGHVVVRAVEPLQIFPWLRFIPGKYRNFVMKYGKTMKELHDDFSGKIESHEVLTDVMENARDYIEAFFAQKAKEAKRHSEAEQYFDSGELVAQMTNLFGAGTLPVSTTLAWSFYFMVKYPEIQAKVHETIDAVMSEDRRTIEICDRDKMPYVDAVFREVQRLGCVLPLSVPRCTAEDVDVQGYHIPRGSVVLLNLQNVLRDPKYWEDPDKFLPERHLDQVGQLRQNMRYFMPFSAGARQCPGQSFAHDELFLFYVNVMNRFTLKLPAGSHLGEVDDGVGDDIMEPPEHHLIFGPRIPTSS